MSARGKLRVVANVHFLEFLTKQSSRNIKKHNALEVAEKFITIQLKICL
jgi:hypothetical protein